MELRYGSAGWVAVPTPLGSTGYKQEHVAQLPRERAGSASGGGLVGRFWV